ncbi:ribonuclease H-like protein [Armillaria novae-zelandiae]|uniref:Ribonuclease H-like protein n=1 Tax=Armillaria novae-zelandiae TaxID=153914 RepID=A0AA39U9P7_9AGAR|nr:ribonuclease H-like protein [Armillaria novae-zelandiae]
MDNETDPNEDNETGTTVAYTAGYCLEENTEDARARSGVWFGPNNEQNIALRAPGNMQSRYAGEIGAISAAAKAVSIHERLEIRTTSKTLIRLLTTQLGDHERRGWVGIKNMGLLKSTMAILRQWKARTNLQWVGADKRLYLPGHKAATQQAREGAELQVMTQSLAYKSLLEWKDKLERRSTSINLNITWYAVKDHNGSAPTDARIWLSMRHPDFGREVKAFLWKNMHDIQAAGARWEKIQGKEHLVICPHCKSTESMEHIMLKCNIPCQTQVWKLAAKVWDLKFPQHPWPRMKYGTILGSVLIKFKDTDDRPIQGANRLFHILVSESAWLIWKLWNEWRIEKEDDMEKWHSHQEVHN